MRRSANIGLKAYAKNKKIENTCINQIPDTYNKIPDRVRTVKLKFFKKKIKKNLD